MHYVADFLQAQGLREQVEERFELEIMPFWTFLRLVFYNPWIWRKGTRA